MLQRPHTVNEYLLKVLVVGEASTGKTSFIKRYVHQFFSRAYKATIGIDFALKTIQLDDHTIVRIQLWDIAGQERFGTMTRAYYKDAVGAFLVFDVDRPHTFEALLKWKSDLDSKVSLSDGTSIPCLMLANKCDLTRQNQLDDSKLNQFCKQHGFIGYIYTSPKNNINIDSAVLILVKEIMRRQETFDSDDDFDRNDTIIVNDRDFMNSKNNTNRSCCLHQ